MFGAGVTKYLSDFEPEKLWEIEREEFIKGLKNDDFYVYRGSKDFLRKLISLTSYLWKIDGVKHIDYELLRRIELNAVDSLIYGDGDDYESVDWFTKNTAQFKDRTLLKILIKLINGRTKALSRFGSGFSKGYFSEYLSDFEPVNSEELAYEKFIRSLEQDEFYKYSTPRDFGRKCFWIAQYLKKTPDGFRHVDYALLDRIIELYDREIRFSELGYDYDTFDDNKIAQWIIDRHIQFKDKKLWEIFEKLLLERAISISLARFS